LSSAVKNDAVHRSADAAAFIGLPPVYIAAVLNGLWQAVTNQAVLDWGGVLRLSEWINQQAADELANEQPTDTRQWLGPRRDMLRLLVEGLPSQPNPIPPEHGTALWAIIASCCQDPNPTSGEEADTPRTQAGFLTLADNTVRPQAISAAVRYALWQRRIAADAELAPVLVVLDEHVDHWQDPSPTVHFVYGQLFAFLVQLDADWARRHVGSIFPLDPAQRLLLDAAWCGYLAGGRLTNGTWELLAEVYSAMVDHLATLGQGEVEEFVATELGHHLLNRLWQGHIAIDDPDGLLRRFYAHVPPATALHLMWSVGAALADLEHVEPAMVARLAAFWEFRVAASVTPNADTQAELAEFGRWFASGHFDPAWALDQLRLMLTRAGRMETADAVLSRVVDLATDHLAACLTVLELWIDAAPARSWRLIHNEANLRRILTIGLAGNPADVQRSTRLISVLSRDHGMDLRDLLSGDGLP
jgi:hypothetical protein